MGRTGRPVSRAREAAGVSGVPHLVVLVDGADRVVGFARATSVHALGILHRTVAVVVVDGEGRLIVRAARGRAGAERWEPVRWRHVLPGETPELAADRCIARLREAVADARPVLRLVYDVPRRRGEREHEFVHVFAAPACATPGARAVALDALLTEVAAHPARCDLRARLVLHALAGHTPAAALPDAGVQ
jgi:hypothetical protein